MRFLALAALLASPVAASAQGVVSPVRWVEIEVGGGLLGGAGVGAADANLRANDRTERPYRLFSADAEFARATAWHLRASRQVAGRWTVEGGVTMSRPILRARTSNDVEAAPSVTITERVDQYFFDAGLVVALDEFRIGRLTPFAVAGAGYLRQLHQGQTVIEHGHAFHAGGGLRYPLLTRGAGFVRTTGLRGDLRAYLLRQGVSVRDRPRPHVAISGSVFVGF